MYKIYEPRLSEACERAVCDAVKSGFISSQAPVVEDFEYALGEKLGASHVVAVSNCTIALELALRVLDIGPGDSVVVPNLTFIAPANTVKLVGADLILADVDPVTLNLTCSSIARVIEENTKAVILVHAFGQCEVSGEIYEYCRSIGIMVIDDAAESLGASVGGYHCGTRGDFGCYSFFANKIITCGEGGVLVCKSGDHERKARLVRDHGMSRDRRYFHQVVASNYRMTAMQAALARSQITLLDSNIKAKYQQYIILKEVLASNDFGVELRKFDDIELTWVNWLNTIYLPDSSIRPVFVEKLAALGIETRPMIFPVSEAVQFANLGCQTTFPVSYDVSFRSLHLPSSPHLNEADINYIGRAVLEVAAKCKY